MKKIFLLIFTITLIVLFSIACSEDKDEKIVNPNGTDESVASCEGCHTNYEHLKAVHTPDPPSSGGGGCGGEIPHIQPYDRVFLGGNGFVAFKYGTHGKLSCVSCHNGVDDTADKQLAHSQDFIAKPSHDPESKCGTCHAEIVARTKNSLHQQGWGQKSMVVLRSGLDNVPDGFDQLSEVMKEGYNSNCATCHASCGDCHVNRPAAGGGGLYNGHNFLKKPNMRDHCTTCHSSRGAHAYFGIAVGTVPDVHLTKFGFDCMHCHNKDEIHGDGNIYDQRYKMPLKPECTDCHAHVAQSNKFHTFHMDTFSCNVCHSQNYNNCGSCHVGGDGARIPSHQKFKIGMNPLHDIKPTFKYALLRESPMAPDSWSNYGTPSLNNFDVRPTYKYATPHNIVKITSRTGYKDATSGQWVTFTNCAEGCHISKNNDGTYNNKEIYLFDEDLLDWEKEANRNVIVDDRLPSSWGL